MYKIEDAYVPGNWRTISQHETEELALEAWHEYVPTMDTEYPNDTRLVTPNGEVLYFIKGSLMGCHEFS